MNVASTDFLIAGALGIGPGLVFLFHALRKYDLPHVEVPAFDSSRVFMLFAVGMIFGGVSSFLSFAMIAPSLQLLMLLLMLIVIALFEELFKMVVTNLKRFQLKKETTFYGLSLGLGMTAVSMVFVAGYIIVVPSGAEAAPIDTLTLVGIYTLIGTYSVSMCALQASTGSFIGHGAATGYVWNYFFQAMISRAVFAVLIVPFLGIGNFWVGLFSLIAAAVFSFFLYIHTYYRILPEALPEKAKKRRRREIRKMRISSKD
ncbi:MAG: hypothetical protein JSV43_02730 [Methanobacteriota archaeon]|nr:MAG: hypothetical protein JSV43_02730 [Euryarchaeota archaeon]